MKGFVGFLLAAGALGSGLYFTLRGGGGGGSEEPALSGYRRRRGLRGHAEEQELKLFIDNDGDLYRQQTTSIMKNLATKLAKGVYDSSKAEKLWMYLVENGAKKYAREAGEGGVWHTMFSMADRKAVAKALNSDFLTEWKLGNYKHLLPKKYQRA